VRQTISKTSPPGPEKGRTNAKARKNEWPARKTAGAVTQLKPTGRAARPRVRLANRVCLGDNLSRHSRFNKEGGPYPAGPSASRRRSKALFSRGQGIA